MEKFYTPKDKDNFVKWLLGLSAINGWTIVFEYSLESAYDFLRKYSTKIDLPVSSRHQYSDNCKLIALTEPTFDGKAIEQLQTLTHVLSVHDNDQMIFLIADDFHEDCFSSSIDFFDKFYEPLKSNALIEENIQSH